MEEISKEQIMELLYEKNKFDVEFYDMIRKDIPGISYFKILTNIRRATRAITGEELKYLVRTGKITID